MRLTLRLAGALLAAAALPGIAFAAPPAAVRGITAELRNANVSVSWDPVPDTGIAYYRVYYSQQSIIDSAGAYDDFEVTPGPENVYVIENPPAVETLYVAVLAVSQSGEESTGFLEEAAVPLQAPAAEMPEQEPEAPAEEPAPPEDQPEPAPEEAVPPPPPAEVAREPVRLLSAEAISATGVLLMFSQPVTIAPGSFGFMFQIVDSSGAELPITNIAIEGATVTLLTGTQERGKGYAVTASEPLQGIAGAALDATARSATFSGHPEGLAPRPPTAITPPPPPPPEPIPAPPAPPPPPPAPTQPQDIANLRLQAELQQNGYYTVTATWQYDPQWGALSHFVVRQSRDRGTTAGPPENLPANVGGVELRGVDPGPFGLAIYTVNAAGLASPGVFQSIDLPGEAARVTPPPAPRPPVTPLPPPAPRPEARAKRLTQTGVGIALLPLLLAAGAFGGWKKARRKK